MGAWCKGDIIDASSCRNAFVDEASLSINAGWILNKLQPWFVGCVLMAAATAAQAAIFTVTNTGDNGGINPAIAAGTGTLRQAIIDSGAASGANEIHFNIPGTGPFTITITPAKQLPAINAGHNLTSLIIDGYSQPGSLFNTRSPDEGALNAHLQIEIVGDGNMPGFYYDCCAAVNKLTLTLQGVAMHGFWYALSGQNATLTPKAKLIVYGSYLGTKIDGTALAALGNSSAAIIAGYDDAQVGGTESSQRNLLSGNLIGFSGGTANASIVVEGNLIGTDLTGTVAIPNTQAGVVLYGNFPGVRVGCTGSGCNSDASRNVISGNHTYGVGIQGTSVGGMQLKGNYIGTDYTGTKPLPNGDDVISCPNFCGGIQMSGPTTAQPATVIGGFNPGEANLIAYNHGPGIVAAFDRLGENFDNQGNAIYRNYSTDVAFYALGREPNDAGDADTGANKHQNFPVIQSASVVGSNLNVTYAVDTAVAAAAYPLRIDFYVPVAHGGGRFLVSDSYPSASAQVPRAVSLPLPIDALPLVGIVATATSAEGFSSEYSLDVVFDRVFADAFGP